MQNVSEHVLINQGLSQTLCQSGKSMCFKPQKYTILITDEENIWLEKNSDISVT